MRLGYRFLILMVVAVMLLAGSRAAKAQSYLSASGKPSFATLEPLELGYTNLANGDLHLEVPFGTFSQRVLPSANPRYVYDSSLVWFISCGVSGCAWAPNLGFFNSEPGWFFVYPETVIAPFYCQNTQCGYISQAADTTQHYFFIDSSHPTANINAADSSGYLLLQPQGTSGSQGVYGPDGTGFGPYVINPPSGISPPVEDTNGNYMWLPFGTTKLIDTVARTVFDRSGGNCPPPTTCYNVPNSEGNISQYAVTDATIPVRTDFGQSNVAEFSGSINVPYTISLPDGGQHIFRYDCDSSTGNPACVTPANQVGYYGTVMNMNLPTGGTVGYGYTNYSDSYGNKWRWLTERATSATWTYTPAVISTCSSTQFGSSCQQKVTAVAPDNSKKVYTYWLNNGAWPVTVQSYDTSGTLLSTVTNTFDFGTGCFYTGCHGNADVRLVTSQTAIPSPAGTLTNQTKYTYDSPQTGNVTAVQQWGYHLSGSFSTTPDQATYTTYTTIGTNAHRRLTVTACNNSGSDSACTGGGGKISQTTYSYDSYGANCPSGGIASVSATYNTTVPNNQRANPTSIQGFVSNSASVTTQLCYDTTGQVTAMIDPRGNTTQYSYTDNYYDDSAVPAQNPPVAHTGVSATNGFLTRITPPLIGAMTLGYYYGSGKVAFSVDQNAADTYIHYQDPLDRPTNTFLPITNGHRAWSLTTYSTNELNTDTYSAVTDTAPSTNCTSCVHNTQSLDRSGRLIQSTFGNDPDGPTSTITAYDSSDRPYTVTNPYRSTSDSSYGVTTLSYDGLARPTFVTEADSSNVNLYYGAAVTGGGGISSQLCATATYGYGYPTLQVDEAGKKKQTWTNAFGQTIEVDEPNSSGTLSLGTCYKHDALGNLTSVAQMGGTTDSTQWRSRTFAYDGLSRLSSATEPESGTTTYTYDNNGNILSKTTPDGLGTGATMSHGSYSINFYPSQFLYSGQVTLYLNGTQLASASFSAGEPGYPIAQALSGQINGNSSALVTSTWTNNGGGPGTVNVTSKTSGSNTDYSMSITCTSSGGSCSSYVSSSGQMSGGTDGTYSSQTVTISYCYDALNRPTAKAFTYSPNTPPTCSGTPPIFPSPVATYIYDQTSYNGLTITNGIGRRTGMTDAAGSEAWSYDAQGNVLADQRTTNGVTKKTSYTYNLDGSLATLTYPSGRTITYTVNSAGRSISAVDTANSINYATNAHYSASGDLASLQNGGSIVSTYIFSSRVQPCWLYATTSTPLAWNSTTCTNSVTAANILDLKLGFTAGGSNGNVVSITNNRDNTRSQNFTYDPLNRLATAQTQTTGVTIPNANCWGLTFGYDSWGNLLSSSTTGPSGCSEPLPLSISVNASNQIAGYCYDAAGNVVLSSPCPSGSYTPAYTYTAENQLASVGGVAYAYDGDGHRVMKSNGKIYWYGTSGAPLDETDSAGNTNNSSFFEYVFFGGQRIARRDYQNNVNYYFTDHLGTSRVSTNSSGAVCYDADFYPFGGERIVSNNCGFNYKFTGYERDTESGLDYAFARHYNSGLGRFISIDPINGSPESPQSWNRYSYVHNNPLNLTDPSGMCPPDDDDTSDCPDDGFGWFGYWSPNTPVDTSGYEGWLNYSYGDPLAGAPILQTSGPIYFNTANQYPNDGSIMSQIMNDPAQAANWTSTFNGASKLVNYGAAWTGVVMAAPFAAPAIAAAPGVISSAAARGIGWYYATTQYASNVLLGGGAAGYVLGRFPGYVQAAETEGMGALNAARPIYNFFTRVGSWDTLNQAYIDAQTFLGQHPYFSDAPVGQEGSGFGMELKYLIGKGLGPETWRFVRDWHIYNH